jgi:putative restriction endonuclease
MNEEILKNLKKTNYVRQAKPENEYWVDFYQKKLNEFKSRYKDNFNIIIHAPVKDNCEDYYIIPFVKVKNLFEDKFLSNDSNPKLGKRWVVTIKNHVFKVTKNPNLVDDLNLVDIKEFFANPYFAVNYEPNDEINEFEIENKKQEINVRVKQSEFRKGVLKNFRNSCCISGITETDLLIASHIIPWAHRNNTRLDPTNGLCLSVLYDKLFDKGYFTLIQSDDKLVIKVIENALDLPRISDPLGMILSDISDRPINKPIDEIKEEYLEYHRSNIFMGRYRPNE